MSTEAGDYGEQGDYATDGAMEDALTAVLDPADEEQAPGTPAPEDDTAPIPGGGKLLEQPDASKVFKAIDGIVMRQERLARNREEKKKHYEHVRAAKPFAYLEKNEDRSVFRATVAPGVDDTGGSSSVPNKMDDLCNKIISQVLSDDFLPDPKPDGDADSDRGAADLAKKFLRADGMTSGTDDRALIRDALNMNISAAAAGVFVWVDKTAGGWRPKQIMAHPRAEDAAKPLYAPRLDDATGQPAMTATGPIMEKAVSPVLRYVGTAKGQPAFTENAAEADRQWLPQHRRKLLNINQIRCVPQSASVFDAASITLLMYDSLGEAKKRFQVLRSLRDEELKPLLEWKPRRWKSIVPDAHRPKDSEGGGSVTDDRLIFWYEHLCPVSPDYQDGACVCVSGKGGEGGTILLRDTLREDVEVDEGKTVPILMDPPVSVFSCISDIEDGDPLGMALLARFGGGKEAWDQIWSGIFDAMFKALNRNVYLPGMSTLTREDLNRRDGSPLDVLTKDDLPMYEETPELPGFVPALLDKLELTLNSAAGTNETSNGLDSSYSASGVAKSIAIKNARVALAQYWQNTVKGLCHYWHIKLQLAQARLTVPQMVRLSGVESAYKQPWFVGADMCGVAEVALQAGSGTMMTPTEKAQHLQILQANQWIDVEQAGELARSSMTDDLGLPPNIHEEAVNREIAAWSNGPPPGWLDEQQAFDTAAATLHQQVAALAQTMAATGVDPATAQQQATAQVEATMQQAGTPMPQAPAVPFEDRANHEEQLVAVYRHRAFSRMQSTVEYGKQPLLWRKPFDERYQAARKAAGIPTVAEQQQAQGAAAADQNYQKFVALIDQKARTLVEATIAKTLDAQLGVGGVKGGLPADGSEPQPAPAPVDPAAEKDKDRQFTASEAEKDRAAQAEQHARTTMSREASVAQRTAGSAGSA